MNRKQLTTFGLIAGTLFLIGLLAIAYKVQCPSDLMRSIFPVIMALAGAGFAIALPGVLKIGSQSTSAVGAMAVFLILLQWPPTQLEADSKGCDPQMEGLITFQEKALAGVTISLQGSDQSTTSDRHGMFSFKTSTVTVIDSLRLQLSLNDIQLDSVFTVAYSKDIVIKVPSYCANCEHFDQTDKLVRSRVNCSASAFYSEQYVAGFTQAGKEQGLRVNCILGVAKKN